MSQSYYQPLLFVARHSCARLLICGDFILIARVRDDADNDKQTPSLVGAEDIPAEAYQR